MRQMVSSAGYFTAKSRTLPAKQLKFSQLRDVSVGHQKVEFESHLDFSKYLFCEGCCHVSEVPSSEACVGYRNHCGDYFVVRSIILGDWLVYSFFFLDLQGQQQFGPQ